MDTQEFQTLMRKDMVRAQMRNLGVHISQEDLQGAWDMLDHDGSGSLTIDEFVTGLTYLQEHISAMHIVQMDCSLKRTGLRAQRSMEELLRVLIVLQGQNE